MLRNSQYSHANAAMLKCICALVFCIFSFLYLFYYQADLLCAGQHVLSHGATTYNPLIGAVLITVGLQVIQSVIVRIMFFPASCVALSYFPSLLILTVLTDISENIDREFSFGAWLWIVPLLLAAWYGLSYVQKQTRTLISKNGNEGSFLSLTTWRNLLIMVVMLFLTGLFSNSNDVFHYRMYVENRIDKKEYSKALDCGIKSTDTDSSLTMLRAYALSCVGNLPDSLFTYPVCGGSKALLPDGITTKSMLIPHNVIVKHYKDKAYAADYRLMSLLLDRDLDGFAKLVGHYYKLDKYLPRHYKEALVLYTHMRSHPVLVFHDSVMDADYQDMIDMQHTVKTQQERESLIRDSYGNTYWCYYLYS